MDVVELKKQMEEKEKELEALRKSYAELTSRQTAEEGRRQEMVRLTKDQVARYSRQLILTEIGPKGQVALKRASVLIVGVGGLGCPAALYLAAAGVGRLGLLDYDAVEVSNLHRQVLHTQHGVGTLKAHSGARAISSLNPDVVVDALVTRLDSSNALQLVRSYDVVLDASDNVSTRYLVSDACVLSNKPLVSGSALRLEGQLTVYHHADGPCYRCLFPHPPPPHTVTSCSDGGVLGVVPGVIGSLQALEAIKIICGLECSLSQSMLLFDAAHSSFRTVRLRARQKDCVACGDSPTLHHLADYATFCSNGDEAPGEEKLDEWGRVSAQEYRSVVEAGVPHVLVDVRPAMEMDICALPDALNLPMECLSGGKMEDVLLKVEGMARAQGKLFVVCRRGNDSQKAAIFLKKRLADVDVKDIRGGLHAWAKDVDPSFPTY